MATRRSHDDLRGELIEFAEKTLREEGVGALAARTLAAQVGCSVGTLYNLFDDLDGVVSAINLRTVKALRKTLAETVADAKPGHSATLKSLALAYFDFALAEPNAWDALFRYKRGPEVPLDIREETAALTEILAKSAGKSASVTQITALWAAVHGVADLAIYRHLGELDDPEEGREIIRLVIETALKGFDGKRREPKR